MNALEFDRLVQKYQSLVYTICRQLVADEGYAQDLTQETFLRFFSQTSYSEIGKQLPYLYTIARNLCTDHFRLRTFDREKELPEDALEDVAQHRMIEQTELTLVIRQALHVLPEDEQELLLLRYVNELTVSELSEITGLSRFAVYRKTKTALEHLKKRLRKEDFS